MNYKKDGWNSGNNFFDTKGYEICNIPLPDGPSAKLLDTDEESLLAKKLKKVKKTSEADLG